MKNEEMKLKLVENAKLPTLVCKKYIMLRKNTSFQHILHVGKSI